MTYKPYVVVTGTIAVIIAIIQLIRFIFQVPVQIGTFNLPMWPSVLAIIIVLTLSLWAIRLVKKN